MWRFVIASIVLVGALIFYVGSQKSKGSNNPPAIGAQKNLQAGDIFPANVELELVGGKKVHGSDFRSHPLLINFWAAWCGPCLHEMPSLVAVQKEYGPRGFEVLAIDMDDNPSEGSKQLKQKIGETQLQIFRGTDSPVQSLFDISGVPFTVLVDKGGTIRFAEAGEADWMSQEMRQKIEAIL